MLPGLLAFALPFLPHEHPLSWTMRWHLIVLASVLTLGVVVIFRTIARPGERLWLLNVISYPASIILALVLFPGHPEFANVILVVLAFGDGSATLFGLLFGRRSLPWNRAKTWVGSLAFLVCSAPLAALAYWQASVPHVSPLAALGCGTVAVLVACVAESLPSSVSDNLRVGLSAAVGVIVAHATLIGWP
jgi:dolichol kinase